MDSLTQEQINEVCFFQRNLSREDEWLFWNISALRAIEEGGPVTFEDKYKTMKNWDSIMNPEGESDGI